MSMFATDPGARGVVRRGNERGTVLIGVLALMVMLSAFLVAASRQVVQETDASTRNRWRQQAFYVAEAGAQYGQAKLIADSSWAGLVAPGKDTREGNFSVAVSRYNESGTALPANQKRVISTAICYGATAQTSLILQFN